MDAVGKAGRTERQGIQQLGGMLPRRPRFAFAGRGRHSRGRERASRTPGHHARADLRNRQDQHGGHDKRDGDSDQKATVGSGVWNWLVSRSTPTKGSDQ